MFIFPCPSEQLKSFDLSFLVSIFVDVDSLCLSFFSKLGSNKSSGYRKYPSDWKLNSDVAGQYKFEGELYFKCSRVKPFLLLCVELASLYYKLHQHSNY